MVPSVVSGSVAHLRQGSLADIGFELKTPLCLRAARDAFIYVPRGWFLPLFEGSAQSSPGVLGRC